MGKKASITRPEEMISNNLFIGLKTWKWEIGNLKLEG